MLESTKKMQVFTDRWRFRTIAIALSVRIKAEVRSYIKFVFIFGVYTLKAIIYKKFHFELHFQVIIFV